MMNLVLARQCSERNLYSSRETSRVLKLDYQNLGKEGSEGHRRGVLKCVWNPMGHVWYFDHRIP